MTYLLFNNDLAVYDHIKEDMMSFWEGIYARYGKPPYDTYWEIIFLKYEL